MMHFIFSGFEVGKKNSIYLKQKYFIYLLGPYFFLLYKFSLNNSLAFHLAVPILTCIWCLSSVHLVHSSQI